MATESTGLLFVAPRRPASQAAVQNPPDCVQCNDSGLLILEHGYCACAKGKALADKAMMNGEHGL